MKSKKDLREDAIGQDDRKNEKVRGNSVRSFAVLTLFAVLAMVISLGTRTFAESEGGRVYAASDGGEESPYEEVAVPTGIAGVVSGVTDTPLSGSTVTRIGSSCEQVIVGQRVQRVRSLVPRLRKSTRFPSSSLIMTAAGVSIIIPVRMFL